MYTVKRSALVMHSAENMAGLVNDVDRYTEFLPWCGGSKVLEQSETEMVASITITFKGIKKTFTTRNQMIGYEKTIMVLVDGPFNELYGYWLYKELGPEASKISLNLEFDFSNILITRTVGPVFKAIADSMVESFCKRADQIYKKS